MIYVDIHKDLEPLTVTASDRWLDQGFNPRTTILTNLSARLYRAIHKAQEDKDLPKTIRKVLRDWDPKETFRVRYCNPGGRVVSRTYRPSKRKSAPHEDEPLVAATTRFARILGGE